MQVQIKKLDAGQDEIGQPTQVWSVFASPYAEIRYQTGLETIKSGAATSIAKASIRIPYRRGITSGMRVFHESIQYDIKAVLPVVGKKNRIDLVCEVTSG
ncbi:MAG TPA: phage head closure protein [Noviherbaspirillum sp.]|nr:phage head closure protein [Noviherbaspirillum sp.]